MGHAQNSNHGHCRPTKSKKQVTTNEGLVHIIALVTRSRQKHPETFPCTNSRLLSHFCITFLNISYNFCIHPIFSDCYL